MENWKPVNLGSLSPIFALSITAKEWGLQDLPPNLIGIEGSWPTISSPSTNQTILAWVNQRNPRDSEIALDAPLCQRTLPLRDNTCLWILEDIGRTTIGPLNSNIVNLTYSFSILVSLVLTALIMGCLSSRPRAPQPPIDAIEGAYNPPDQPRHSRPVGDIEKAFTESNVTRDIRRCTELLREMYSLDLEAWGMEGVVLEEEGQRVEIEKRADAIFREVWEMAEVFQTNPDFQWTEEERRTMQEIFEIIQEQRARRKRA